MPLLNTVNRSHLKTLFGQVGSLETSLLYTGFAILCKDLIEYLAARGITAAAVETFRGAYNKALSLDYLYLSEFHPLAYASLSAAKLPSDLTGHVASENMDLTKLQDKTLVTKLAPLIGWLIFREYSSAIKGPIKDSFGESGLPDVYEDREAGAIDLAEKLLSKPIPNEYYWFPVTLYLCILLYKTDFKSIE